ncbi:MAG: response regulator [Vicinamibacteria bacterium]|nr:response regulator [Vicinamibacteria bacterium]
MPESDQELREFLDQAAFGLRFVGPDGRILWANRAELQLIEGSLDECIGHHIAEFLLDPKTAADLLDRVARKEAVESYPTRIRTRSGSTRQVLIDGSGLFRNGHLVHSRFVTRDITGLLDREQGARHRVEATSHLKDEFLALLSHELRTPLGAILVWLGLLRQGGFDPAERERALEIIERSARALERIIEDLLHASRIAAGGLMLHPQLVDLAGIVQIAVDAAAGDAALKALSLVCDRGTLPVWVKGDPGRLQQVLSNLLSNAIKFTPTGGAVKVTLDVAQQQARLQICDTGEGMSAAFLPLAFERFRQQDTTSTRAHHGLGLGLYVVRHVVGNHGGFVSAESPGPGRGSVFTVLLPLAAHHSPEEGPPRPSRGRRDGRPPDGLTVLLVDDEEDVREALRLILQQNGMIVTTATSAGEAFELLLRMQPDILLSDIAMPGEDGLSLIRRVRLLPPLGGGMIPAAALSAYAGTLDRRQALLAGFQHHVAKPVDPAQLLDVIADLAQRKQNP